MYPRACLEAVRDRKNPFPAGNQTPAVQPLSGLSRPLTPVYKTTQMSPVFPRAVQVASRRLLQPSDREVTLEFM
jgi:hypothetical protein